MADKMMYLTTPQYKAFDEALVVSILKSIGLNSDAPPVFKAWARGESYTPNT